MGRHLPVLAERAVELLNCRPGGAYVDGTIGEGGHAELILQRLEGTAPSEGMLIGVDLDGEVLEQARARLGTNPRLHLYHDNFANLKAVLADAGWQRVDGILLDLGLSSFQLDSPERGFSFQAEAPLDMRMDRSSSGINQSGIGGPSSLSAAEIVNRAPYDELVRILRDYGEESGASLIAGEIVERRKEKPFATTKQLADLVVGVVRVSRRRRIHPATKTFQALRIAVNNELDNLERVLEDGVEVLAPGGRFCIISFHSLEDRLVKQKFRFHALDCTCPPDFPVCQCDKRAEMKVVTRRAIKPTEAEVSRNPRSRSARLRVAEKVSAR